MTVTTSSFRQSFPEFGSDETFPDDQLSFWIGAAGTLLSADRWGALLDLGTILFVAHNVAIGARDAAAAAKGGVGGASGGVVASKSVDKVSVSYDTGAATIDGGGAWNTTAYGVRYLQLARMVGVGGVQL